MSLYKVRQSLVGDTFAYQPEEVIEWSDEVDAARMVAAGILEPHVPTEIPEPETPEATRAKSRKKETR